jgi:propanediol utilization protein
MRVLLEGSARHAHLSREDADVLFGKGFELSKVRDLSQPGEFLTEEKVTLAGPKGRIERVSILGPIRKATQAEISLSDARKLGVEAPIRLSGDLAGSSPVRLEGPAGSVDLSEGCVVAKRHLHVTPEDVVKLGIAGRETILVKTEGERGLIFDEISVRVSENFSTAIHLDYDEMNAAGLSGESYGEIVL